MLIITKPNNKKILTKLDLTRTSSTTRVKTQKVMNKKN